MRIEVKIEGPTPDFSCTSLTQGVMGVVTKTVNEAAAKVGSPVLGVPQGVFFPLSRQWANWGGEAGYRYRHLRPGETVTFSGE